MRHLRSLAHKIPGVRYVYRRLRTAYHDHRLRSSDTERIFADIVRDNRWGGGESVSGPGSDPAQTRVIVAALPQLLREFAVTSLLDIPCGDFRWMREVELGDVDYTGADIVGELVQDNERRYGGARCRFRRLDVISDALPAVDLVICRDCLVHLSHADVKAALRNLCGSGSGYLCVTTFPGRRDNVDILTGRWRPLNLQAPPYGLPPPLRLITEQCREDGGRYRDKALGLWRMADVETCLARSGVA